MKKIFLLIVSIVFCLCLVSDYEVQAEYTMLGRVYENIEKDKAAADYLNSNVYAIIRVDDIKDNTILFTDNNRNTIIEVSNISNIDIGDTIELKGIITYIFSSKVSNNTYITISNTTIYNYY